ncbi:MAG: PilN domain-containing protein [Cellvibrionales bacterium]|nr:PilN domain-containing protein [Cellvibrionales bacterium]
MATINLLPWREERREELKKQFLVMLAGILIAACAVIFVWQSLLNSQIESQLTRNQILQRNINQLEDQVREINALKKQKKELVERMTVIQSLQGNRPVIVHIFDEIVRTLPDGVYFKSISRKGNQLTIVGVAESNNRVSSLMRQLDSSDWFDQPNLQEVKASKSAGGTANDFSLLVNIVSPSQDNNENIKS